MLNCLHYTEAVDIWYINSSNFELKLNIHEFCHALCRAVGCILAEMLQREPLFPGNDYIHQLKLIIKFMGTPKQEDIEFVKNPKALRFLTKLPIYKPNKLEEVFPTANHDVRIYFRFAKLF